MDPQRLRLSFVIPARDEAATVAQVLESVQRQSLAGPLEAVVVVNGSKDATADSVRSFKSGPELRVRLLVDPVAGVARARNRGAVAAGGEVLVFLDADSYAAPDLAACVLRRVDDGWPAGCIRLVPQGHDVLDRACFGLMEFGKRLFSIRANMFYCRRDLYLATRGMDESLQLAEDLEYLSRLRAGGNPVAYVAETYIATSPRRLHSRPLRLGTVEMFTRWSLARWGIGRRWQY
ncbi:MAG: glycosyltransferase family 2 protein [Candidatus Dormibacteraeota bacterium]|nr:glycosyltransferase family 2 protein [Candidatus Dormibacteraeota bacterium]